MPNYMLLKCAQRWLTLSHTSTVAAHTMNDTLNKRRNDQQTAIKSYPTRSIHSQSVICTTTKKWKWSAERMNEWARRAEGGWKGREKKKNTHLNVYKFLILIRSALYSGQTGTFHCCQSETRHTNSYTHRNKRRRKKNWTHNSQHNKSTWINWTYLFFYFAARDWTKSHKNTHRKKENLAGCIIQIASIINK